MYCHPALILGIREIQQLYLVGIKNTDMNSVQITLLGTNGWYSSNTGNTLSILVQTPLHTIILDAGDGIRKVADLCPVVDKPAYLLLSHLHLDHICGLHTLARLRFEHGLVICGPPGIKEALSSFIAYPYTVPAAELPYPVTIIELPEGEIKREEIPFPLTTGLLIHTQPVYGYRIDLGKRVTFCTDTGVCENYMNLAQDADLLISECSYLPGQETPEWPHLNPDMAIASAKKAGVKRLALVHFAADLYTTIQMRREIREKALPFPELIIGEDDMVIRL
jgi:ribonuclease BN (tRNA processing enzyme)